MRSRRKLHTSAALSILTLLATPASLLSGCGMSFYNQSPSANSQTSTSTTSGDTGGGGALAPLTFSIATDRALAISTMSASLNLSSAAAGTAPDAASNAAAGGSTDATSNALTAGGALSPTGSGSTGGASGSAGTDTTTGGAFTANITVTATWPGGATQACSTMTPFDSAITCSLAGFTFPSTAITTTADFQLKGYASNGGVNDYRLSNKIPVSQFGYRQITNITGAQNTDDSVVLLMSYGSKIYFGGLYGLFSYDPDTTTLTRLADNTNVGSSAGGPFESRHWAECGGKLFFEAYNSVGKNKLFIYDGSTFGAPPNTSANASLDDSPIHLTCYNGSLFYYGRNSNSVWKLWRYTVASSTLTQIGNTAGNQATADLSPGVDSLSGLPVLYTNPASGQEELFFFSTDSGSLQQLFSWNDYTSTLKRLTTSEAYSNLHVFNNQVFFVGKDTNNNNELKTLRYDPSSASPVQVAFISDSTAWWNDANFDTAIHHYITYNGKLFAFLRNSSHAYKLYLYDPSGGTFTQISNTANAQATNDLMLDSGAGENMTIPWVVYNSRLYFMARNSNLKYKLYSYDDSSGTVAQVTNTTGAQASNDFDPTFPNPLMTIYNNKIFFVANNANGKSKLYTYDSAGSVAQVTDIKGAAANDLPWPTKLGVALPIVSNNRLFFQAYSGTGTGIKIYSFCDPGAGCTGP